MSVINKNSFLYQYTSSTSAPTSDFKTYIGFSSSLSSMAIGSEYTMWISNYALNIGTGTSISDIIDLLDGIKSDKKDTPIKSGSGKSSPKISSARCTLSNIFGVSLTFDIIYDSQGTSEGYDDTNFIIKVIDIIGSGNFNNEETLYFSYNFYGEGGDTGIQSGGEYQIDQSGGAPSDAGDDGLLKLITSSGTNLADVSEFQINTLDLNGTTYDELYTLLINSTHPDSLITLRKENSLLTNVYKVTSGTKYTNYYSLNVSSVAETNETFATYDGVYLSITLGGASGTSGSSGSSGTSGSSGSSGSSGTSGSSGSSGTSGSSGSSGTSGSSGSSGTSGSSGSSGTSGSSGSSGTSGSSGSSGTSGSSGSSGTSGSSGSSGTSGSSGSSGTSGSSGSSGTSGSSGSSGTSGSSGSSGTSGSSGSSGTSGVDGVSGTSGSSGSSGSSGTSGSSGSSGTSGVSSPGCFESSTLNTSTTPTANQIGRNSGNIYVNSTQDGVDIDSILTVLNTNDSGIITLTQSNVIVTFNTTDVSEPSPNVYKIVPSTYYTGDEIGDLTTDNATTICFNLNEGTSGTSGSSGSSGTSGSSGSSGTSGSSGSSGSSGTSGSSGSSGSSGTSGSSGSSGTSGSSGSSGTSGSSGSSGTSGSSGSSGTSGSSGSSGTSGSSGSSGTSGSSGSSGTSGSSGSSGTSGSSGSSGTSGSSGSSGTSGSSYQRCVTDYQSTASTPNGDGDVKFNNLGVYESDWADVLQILVSFNDDSGNSNSVWLDNLQAGDKIKATNDTDGGTNNYGQYTITALGDQTFHKVITVSHVSSNGSVPTGKEITICLDIFGTSGSSGSSGSSGTSGSSGSSGSSGTSGSSGSSGSSGTSGSSGSSGTSGSSGSSGTSGSSGSSGTSGSSGSSGTSGSSGSSGSSGTSGSSGSSGTSGSSGSSGSSGTSGNDGGLDCFNQVVQNTTIPQTPQSGRFIVNNLSDGSSVTSLTFSPDGYIGSTGPIDEGFPSYYGPIKENNTYLTAISMDDPNQYITYGFSLIPTPGANPPTSYKSTGSVTVVDESTNFTFTANKSYCLYFRINI